MSSDVSAPTAEHLERAREIVAQYLEPTPAVTLWIGERPVRAKLEGLQPTGSFKIRGALVAIEAAHRADPHGAVITASAGNHGLGVAHASALIGVRATVVVPANASQAKVKKLLTYDIELIQHGASYDEAQAHAQSLAASRGIRFVSPFNDPDVIAGQSTVADELLVQAPDLEHLVVPVGGGGLLSGTLMTLESRGRPDVRVTGVQPTESAALYHVLRGVPMSEVVHRPTIADGLAGGGDEGAITNEIVAKAGVDIVLVGEPDIRRGVRDVVVNHGIVMEGSSAIAYQAIALDLCRDRSAHVGFLATGRNIATDLLVEILAAPH
jgi:threonine dehydratase